ncbi:MAG: immunoglobulin domain-containing protein [Planctomycetota bacterium]
MKNLKLATMGVVLCLAVGGSGAMGQCLYPPSDVYATETWDCSPIEIGWSLVDNALGYRIDRAPVSDPTAVESLGFVSVLPFYDTTATPGVDYLYWVVAQGECGDSEAGGPDTGTIYLPASPQWVQASDNQYCDLIVVSWDTSGGGSNYDLYRSESWDFASALYVGSASGPDFYDYAVAGNVGYVYWAVATSACGSGAPGASDIGYSNFGMSITSDPSDQQAPVGGSASFSVEIRGFASFEWYHDGGQVFDGGNVSGAGTRTLSISPVSSSDAGQYYCVAYGGCGSRESNSATLTIQSDCAADFDSDGTLDFFDYDAFVICFEGGACPSDKTADFDADGTVDFFDYDAFVVAFEAGC